ncbi:MAG: type IV pilus assembly protein PilM [Oligoflexia bacterium]|nr:type IV pilus assembly protein PilM [Oligoflexia bacterium]
MSLLDFLQKKEYLVSIDIGSTAIKLIEFDMSGSRPRVVNIGVSPVRGDIFAGNVITRAEKVAEQISGLVESNAISDKRVVTAVPGPSVFTKKIKMPKQDPGQLKSSIGLEAGNFIPHNLDAVRLDYHIIGESSKNQLDVLIVAVKNEILDSFTGSLSLAGLETAVVDVDVFALQNIFELSHPELTEKTVALVNIGARYSSINICRGGESLFTGDIAVGGKMFTDAIAEGLGVTTEEAEQLKLGKAPAAADGAAHTALMDSVHDIVERQLEYISSEFNRQLSFFWSASGSDESIDQILLTGGGALIPGLCAELKEKTGVACELLNPLAVIEAGEGVDADYLKEVAPLMSIALGMAIRQPGDRIIPDVF